MTSSPTRTVNPWIVLAIASAATFMVMLDTQVLFVAFDDIRASFPSVSFTTMSWTLSAYTIALAATLVTAGRMTDRFGRRRTFVTGLVVFTTASLLCGLAPTPGLLVAFRVVQAFGAAALMPSSLALVLSVFPSARVPVAVATWGAAGAFAAGVGPTVGALLVEGFGWRSVFLVNVPVGIVAVALSIRLLPESREAVRERFPDVLGILLLAGSLTLLSLGIVQSEQWGAVSIPTASVVACGLAVLAWFVRRSLAVPHPALDLSLFTRPSFRWANITTAVFTIGFTAMFFALIQFMTTVWHYSVVETGLAMMPAAFIVMVLAPFMGRVAARYGQRRLLVPGGLVYAASGAYLLFSLDTDPAWATDLLPASLLTGIGASLVLPQLTSAAVRELSSDEYGAGAAVNQAIRQFGATFGIALTVALLAGATPSDAVEHFQRVWSLILACGVLASVAALALPRASRPVAPDPAPVPVGTTN
ncbi:MFS transporter [Nocardioides cavernaquae]|uniref:DHA2 family efflux MFS transporter permease subunit n=1 Tax=Nocardioides cavernaquae TaxID=2321396 RepID=A0A3A5HA97_9ACTN|nr:MFS transporter [Nocardioides cavernaquae]RJS46778.1 DHA2 family efflux MFS transporter permease subunit [Nocardioides cavernaquae]